MCIRASHFDDEKSVKVRYWKAMSDRDLEYKEFVPIVGPEVWTIGSRYPEGATRDPKLVISILVGMFRYAGVNRNRQFNAG